jgi:hypothetical protein
MAYILIATMPTTHVRRNLALDSGHHVDTGRAPWTNHSI